MVRAFGYCNDVFDSRDPGRLCRGRERWIEGLPDAPAERLYRTVCSSAVFSDDSARDARRGFHFSGVSAGEMLTSLFPKEPILAFCEAGDPRALPEKLLVEEDYTLAIASGLRSEPAVRWVAETSPADIDLWLVGEKDGLAAPRADGFIIGGVPLKPELLDALFLLVGYSDIDDRPARRYAPGAIVEALRHCKALVLLHLDKHAPAIAIYSHEPLESDGLIDLT